MGKIDDLANNYERHLSVPWQQSVTGAQKIMLCIYDKEDERNLRAKIGDFEIRTENTQHNWVHLDCTDIFSHWLAQDDYCDAYFEAPDDIGMKVEGEFKEHVIDLVRDIVSQADDQTVVALSGVASLYGFIHLSELIRAVEADINGRLVIFFPGSKDENNYRLLDARDGWNYLANSITAHSNGGAA